MQYKVPQNIDKEDQIVGSLTLLEFSYLAIAGALDILISQTMQGALRVLIIGIISVIGLALAFLKVQDRPLLVFIESAILYAFSSKKRVWDKDVVHSLVKISKKVENTQAPKAQDKNLDPERIEQLTKVLDTHGNVEGPAEAASPFKNVPPAG